MSKKLRFFFILITSINLNAQYTEVINSNRPGFSESAYSVGLGIYQFETSFFYRKANAVPTFSNPEALGLNLLFRTSFFFEKLELNLNTTLENDKIAFRNVFESSYNQLGLSQLTLGAKYLVYQPTYKDKSKEIRSFKKRMAFDWRRAIPAIAVYGGVNFGNVLTTYHNRGNITPKAGILLQNEFSQKFNLVTNLYYDYIESDFPEFSYIITTTYNFNDYWSGFIEFQSLFNNLENKSNLGIGVAYLHSKNLQFNTSVRESFQENSSGLYGSLGISYRINRHEDGYDEIDEFGNKIIREEASYGEKKGFFGRLFNGFGLFKKKKKSTVKLDTDSPREKPKRQRKKAVTKKRKEGGFFSRIFGKKKKKKKAYID